MGVGSELAVGELYAVARQAAQRQAQRHPGLDVDEVVQETVLALLAALRSLRAEPERLLAYLGRVAQLTAWAYAWQLRSPVRHSTFRRGLALSAAQATAGRVPTDELRHEAAPVEAADAHLGGLRWAAQVRAVIEAVLAEDAAAEREAMRRVLLGEEAPAAVAAETGLPVQRLYVVSLRTKRRILACAQLRALWRDLPSRGDE